MNLDPSSAYAVSAVFAYLLSGALVIVAWVRK